MNFKSISQSVGFLFCLLVLSNSSFAQWRIPTDSLYQLIKTNSVHKSFANWQMIDASFNTCIISANDNIKRVNCFVEVFKELKDSHSKLIYQNKEYSYSPNMDAEQALNPLLQKAELERGKIKTNLFKFKYAYIQIPGNKAWGGEINAAAQNIADQIEKYDANTTKGFIVDLRLNTGGDLSVMLSGLHSLLGEGNIGGEIDAHEKLLRQWEIKDGNFSQQGYQPTSIKKSSKSFDKIPVIVLISPITSGAGALTAIAFKNRPHTYFLGDNTRDGYSTSTIWRQISDDLVLVLAEGYVRDRKNKIYPRFVPTDSSLQVPDTFDDLTKDKKTQAAVRWLDKIVLKKK